MSFAWDDGSEPPVVRITWAGWIRVVLRGIGVFGLLAAGLLFTFLLRLVERPLFGLHRPWTPWITQTVCALALIVLGLRLKHSGHQMRTMGALVTNHASWLDIFVLNARRRVYFIAKAEVANWPGIGLLPKATGAVFIRRDRREAQAQVEELRGRFEAGHKILFFPEGTSSDSRRVLPFKATLFQSFFADGLRERMLVQPVTVIYRAAKGVDPRFYAWWGEMEFFPNLLAVLAQSPQGEVEVIYHEPVAVSEFENRKALAAYCEATVRAPLDLELAERD